MTNEEALRLAHEEQMTLDDLIAKGKIPPRPDFVAYPEKWHAWFERYVRCAGKWNAGRCFGMRIVGTSYCAAHQHLPEPTYDEAPKKRKPADDDDDVPVIAASKKARRPSSDDDD